MKLNYFTMVVLIASISGLLSGFDCGVISGAMLYIKQDFNITSSQLGLLVSSVSFGAIFGAVINGYIADKIGRKYTLIISGILFFFGSFLSFLSNNIFSLMISRLIIGGAVGIVSFCGPLYLSEISKKESRGMIVSFYQASLTFGILLSYVLNYIFSDFELNWRLMLGFGVIPSAFLIIGMMFNEDTPRWLILNNKLEEAKTVLSKLHNEIDINSFLIDIKSNIDTDFSFKFDRKLLKPLLIGIGIMFCQIATGINAIIYYAPTIFIQTGFQNNKSSIAITILIGIINFIMTFVAIKFVDKLGRKPLLYIGLFGMSLSLLLLSFSYFIQIAILKYLCVFAILAYIVCFSASLGPVALLIISEIFPLNIRGKMMSFSIISNFVFNFVVTTLFPIMLYKIGGGYTFICFFVVCLISILFIYFFVPETKGVSLEEIEKNFSN